MTFQEEVLEYDSFSLTTYYLIKQIKLYLYLFAYFPRERKIDGFSEDETIFSQTNYLPHDERAD
jgi:hypothetical protein